MRIEDPSWLRDQAKRCTQLAKSTTDRQTAHTLKLLAAEYETKAAEMEARLSEPQPQAPAGTAG
jgi:hypothetical protein